MNFEVLHRDPLILFIPEFVSAEEAAYCIAAGDRAMERSKVVCNDPNGCIDARRTSESAHLGLDPLVEPIRQRAREFSRLATCETLQVVRYDVGQEFKPHLDQFDTSTDVGKREVRSGGQRGATFLVYLNEPAAGGATVFPEVGLSVLPKARAAVFWRHQLPNGRTDPRTLHGGAPVTRGRKYAMNCWLRLPQQPAGTQINPQLQPRAP